MPQATPAPKQSEKDAEKAAQAEAAKQWAELVARATGSSETPAERQVVRAVKLEVQRAELMKKIADNRDYLRLMDRNEELSEDQAEFLDTFYPEKERGERRSKEDIEATRRAREAARKDNGNS